MTASALPPITEDDIAEYLANSPGFFERHAELLASVVINSPHGQRAVSLHERQAELLREKIKVLEHRVMDMVRYGGENAAIARKIHDWSRQLAAARNAGELPAMVQASIAQDFDVPQVALRLWGVADAYTGAAFTQGVSEDLRSFAASLTMPFCGPNLGFEATGWLAHAAQAQSLALLPLRRGAIEDTDSPAFGLLVLASHDAKRFDATMGTDFLTHMAELAGSALSRLL